MRLTAPQDHKRDNSAPRRIRTAGVVALVSLALPGPAQSQGAEAFEATVAVCSDPEVMPDDWDARLVGWTPLDPNPEVVATFTAGQTLLYAFGDDDGIGETSIPEQIAFHGDLALDNAYYAESVARNIAEGRQRFLTHPTGWVLSLEVDPRPNDVAHSRCLLWHDAPGDAALSLAFPPAMGLPAMEVSGGLFRSVEGQTFEPPNDVAPLSYASFLSDFGSLQQILMPDTHPSRDAARFYFEVHLSAFGREDRL